jgi:hypothetical protein
MGCSYSLEERITVQHRHIALLRSRLPQGTTAAGSCFPPDFKSLDAAYKELYRLEELRPVPHDPRELSD